MMSGRNGDRMATDQPSGRPHHSAGSATISGAHPTKGKAVQTIELRKVADLTPYARNTKKHPPEQVDMIARSVESFGWTRPILVSAGQIVAGHGAALAALAIYARGGLIYPAPGRDAGAEPFPAGFVPVLDATGWRPEQFRAYVIADNKIAEAAEWDEGLLKLELNAIAEADEKLLGLMGFDGAELTALMLGEVEGLGGDPEGGGDQDKGPKVCKCPACGHSWEA